MSRSLPLLFALFCALSLAKSASLQVEYEQWENDYNCCDENVHNDIMATALTKLPSDSTWSWSWKYGPKLIKTGQTKVTCSHSTLRTRLMVSLTCTRTQRSTPWALVLTQQTWNLSVLRPPDQKSHLGGHWQQPGQPRAAQVQNNSNHLFQISFWNGSAIASHKCSGLESGRS